MAPPLPTRLTALDLFRGVTVAGMIIVNSPGDDSHIWWPLDHAPWNGFTPTDLVFPAFLCAVGVALALSFPRTVDAAMWRRVARRTISLIALGWAWQFLVRPDLPHFRLMGVLPRIGLCYGIVASFVMLTARRDPGGRARLDPVLLAVAALAILIVYAALMLLVPVPGHGAGDLTPDGNLAGYVDRVVLTIPHMWRHGTGAAGTVVYDPEGLLSTLPALANVLLGMLAAIAWQRAPQRAVAWIALGGVALTLVGWGLDPLFPINKRLWTSSYALLSTGLAALLFALAMIVADRKGPHRWLAPFRLLGMNAILGYMISLLLPLAGNRLQIGDSSLSDMALAGMRAFAPDPYLASFLCSLAVLAATIGLLVPLHRRGIHLRL